MKNSLKKLLIGFIGLLVFSLPIKANAASFGISASKSVVSPGEKVTFIISSDTAFSASAVKITYDASKWTLISNRPLQGSEVVNSAAGAIVTSVSVTTGSIIGSFYEVVLQAGSGVTSGNSQISVSTSDCWAEDGITPIAMNSASVNLTHYIASGDATLKSLNISNCQINFQSNVTEYTCAATNANSVTISASANDSKAKVSGVGNNNLSYGNNALKIVVTAENGITKTYIVNITKNDTRNGNSDLSSLIVEGHDIKFNASTYEYTIDVEENIEKVTIKAVVANSNSKLSGVGTFNLNIGSNRFPIKVTAENGNIKTYFVNVNRKDKDNVSSTTLIEFSYNGIKLDPSKKVHAIGVGIDAQSINLIHKTNSKTTSYVVNGNNNLKEGINIVTLKVSDIGLEDVIYTLIVNKVNVILDNIPSSFNSDAKFYSYDTSIFLSGDTYKNLKNTDYKLTINNLNSVNGLNYAITIDKNSKISGNSYLYITKSDEDPLTYDANIPSGINIKVLVQENIDNSYKLYSYHSVTNSYQLISDKANINNYYLEFTSSGASKYVLSKEDLTKSEVVIDSDKDYSGILWFIGGLFIASAGFVSTGIYLKKRKNI